MRALHTITRQYLIINKVRKGGYPSHKQIHNYLLENDFEIHNRTLDRDLAAIRYDLGIEIAYNTHYGGYYLDYESSGNIEDRMKFLEIAVMTGSFNEVFKDVRTARNLVSFDCEEMVRGVHYIPKILFAIRNRKEVNISYRKFTDSVPEQRTVKPGLLKEYQNRWYLAGLTGNNNELRLFALDRTMDIQLGEKSFRENEIKDLRERFIHVIGISEAYLKPAFIELTFSREQANYIKTLPWHASQEIVDQTGSETTFRFFVVPNYELFQKILAEGNNITRIAPKWLEEKVEKKKN